MKTKLLEDQYPTHYLPGVGRQVMANGGAPVEGEVSFLEDDQAPLPTFAQPQTQSVTQALDAARAVPKKEYAPFGVLPLKETDEGIEFDPYAGLLGTVTRPAKYFYETMSGQKEMDPTSDEAIRAATDIAGAVTGGSTAFERPSGALAAGASRPVAETPRITNPLGMHSAAAEVARALPQQTGTIEQMLAMIKNKVNPEELHWSGVSKAFEPGQKVTAEELASHFESKLPSIQETVYGDVEGAVKDPRYDDLHLRTRGGENYREIVLHHTPNWTPQIEEKYGRFGFTGPDNKYRDYWTRQEAEQAAKSMARTAGDFTESHHDEPNIIGHLRMSDMAGPEGEKILNVHEFQSDWGQKARKHGVITGKEAEDRAALIQQRNDLDKVIRDEYGKMKQEAIEKFKQAGFDEETSSKAVERQSPNSVAQLARGVEGVENYNRLIEQRAQLYDDINAVSSRIPAAPYVSSREGQHNTPGWTDLLIKRVMQEAEKGGYDKVVWDTPREQGQRYMNMPNIVKGMKGYYGDVLPKRFKKVVPEAKLGEHDVGAPQTKIDFSLNHIKENVPGEEAKLWAAKEEHPDLNNEQLLRMTGLYTDFMIVEAAHRGITLPDVYVSKAWADEGKFPVYDEDAGHSIGMFESLEEANAAANSYLEQKAEEAINSGHAKRPGFAMTPELKERVRKGFSAYRRGGEVEDAIDVAKSL